MLPSFRLLLLLLLGAVLIVGVSLEPRLLWLAVAFLGAVALLVGVDVALTPRPAALEVERINDNRLSLGAHNPVTLLVANRSPRALMLQVRDEYPFQFYSDQVIVHGRAPAYGLLETRYYLRPVQRGDYAFGDINVRYASQMGTFTWQARYPASAPVRVYPNVLDVRKYDLMARKGLLFELGLRQQRVYGGGTEFERLREYSTDDEFRRMNWKATARRGKPIVAEYETERSQQIMCVIDSGRLMAPPIGEIAKLDYAINAALLLSYVALLKGDHVGMLTFADDVRTFLAPRRGKGQFYRTLEALYNIQHEGVEADYARALSYLSVKQKRRSLVVLFTDLVTLEAAQPLIAHMARLSQHHLPVCVVLSDPNITRYAGSSTPSSSAAYERAVAEMLLDERRVVLDTMQRSGVLTIDVPADKLSIAVINAYLELKARGKL